MPFNAIEFAKSKALTGTGLLRQPIVELISFKFSAPMPFMLGVHSSMMEVRCIGDKVALIFPWGWGGNLALILCPQGDKLALHFDAFQITS